MNADLAINESGTSNGSQEAHGVSRNRPGRGVGGFRISDLPFQAEGYRPLVASILKFGTSEFLWTQGPVLPPPAVGTPSIVNLGTVELMWTSEPEYDPPKCAVEEGDGTGNRDVSKVNQRLPVPVAAIATARRRGSPAAMAAGCRN